MKTFRSFLCFFLILLGVDTFSQTPDLILANGNFYTSDIARPNCEAIAILNNRILAIGNSQDILKLRGSDTRVIDLNGKFGMPGIIEGHGHLLALGQSLINLNLLNTASWEEIIKMVVTKKSTLATGEWLQGRGWHQEKWAKLPVDINQGYPTNSELSKLTPDNPVILYHASGHALIANSKAMSEANIDFSTPDPKGGRIIRDQSGKPTGVFEENAMDLFTIAIEHIKNQQSSEANYQTWKKTINIAQESCLMNGITGFHDAGVKVEQIKYYTRLADEMGLKIRMWVMINDSLNTIRSFKNRLPIVGYGQQMLTVKAIKQYIDGALGSHGAWLLEPYQDKPGFVGQNVTPLSELEKMADFAFDNNLQLCIHAIGDKGNREVLNLYEKAMGRDKKRQDLRWRIEHAQHVSPNDFDRFKELGVIASMQAIHCTSDGPFVEKRLGKERAQVESYAWRTLIDRGVHIANGTDTPVENLNPFECIYASVSRKRLDSGFSFYPEQKMSRSEALNSYTIWNAYAAFEDDIKGSITPGKLADIIILDTNLLNCEEDKIASAKVVTTICNGKVVYQIH